MKTDDGTQIQILTHIVKKLLSNSETNIEDFLKSEFKNALIAKYNSYKFPKMNVTIKHQ